MKKLLRQMWHQLKSGKRLAVSGKHFATRYPLYATRFIVSILILLNIQSVSAQGSLYDQVKYITEQELHSEGVETESSKFLSSIFPPQDGQVTHDKVNEALQGFPSVCEDLKGDRAEGTAPTITYFHCKKLVDVVMRSILTSVQHTRTTGRDLQLLTTTFEREMLGLSSRQHTVPLQLQSILNIWQSGVDVSFNPLAKDGIRYVQLPDNIEQKMEEIGNIMQQYLETEDSASPIDGAQDGQATQNSEESETEEESVTLSEEFVAVVWRYRHGYKSVRRSRGVDENTPCTSDELGLDGTELQYLNAVWCEVEEVFEEVTRLLEAHLQSLDPPLLSDEVAVFNPITLPHNLIVWVRSDDIGLDFDFPVQPVLPSLDCSKSDQPEGCIENAILGGHYPEPPRRTRH